MSHFDKDYREKARTLADAFSSHCAYKPWFVDALAAALHDAHLAGRREGIEEAAKVAERMYGPYWSKGYRTASVVIARDIRALLRGGENG